MSYTYWIVLFGGIYFLPLIIIFFLKKQFPQKYFLTTEKIWRKSVWLVFAMVIIFLMLIANSRSRFLFDDSFGNFWLHFLGGGFVSTIIHYFIKNCFTFKVSNFLDLVTLYMTVSSLGVLNELLEYALDTILQIKFTPGRTDTWKDLLANTLGALSLWLIFKFLEKIFAKSSLIQKNSKLKPIN